MKEIKLIKAISELDIIVSEEQGYKTDTSYHNVPEKDTVSSCIAYPSIDRGKAHVLKCWKLSWYSLTHFFEHLSC